MGGGSKMDAVFSLLKTIRKNAPGDKVIIVSNFKVVLDLFARLLPTANMPFVRLDGSTKNSERQAIVNMFNRTSSSTHFAFLLSAKAGGAGLNLIGANRLIMVDAAWNPATDFQAMARTRRHGQKKSCFNYRFFTAGTLDEVILQRQLLKGNLATNVMEEFSNEEMKTLTNDTKGVASKLSPDELKDCFTLKPSTKCDTNEKLAGSWGAGGEEEWKEVDNVLSTLVRERNDIVTFVKYGKSRDVVKRSSLGNSSVDEDDEDDCSEVSGKAEESSGDDEPPVR